MIDLLRSPGVYAWEGRKVLVSKSPIMGLSRRLLFLNPGVNAWARESFTTKLGHHGKTGLNETHKFQSAALAIRV
jgi:hypothetical protein